MTFNEGRMTGSEKNREVVEAIHDLTGRFNELSQAVSSMSVVLDTGVLVGSMDKKIDRQLGILSARKGRGN